MEERLKRDLIASLKDSEARQDVSATKLATHVRKRAKEKIIIVFLGWRALNDDFDEAMVRELVWFLPCPARCSSRDAREFEQKPPLGAWRIIDFLGSKY